MRFADCVSVMLFEPRKRVIGLVHAGWLGTVKKIAAHAVEAMVQNYQTDPQDILAGIGPSIAVHHYEVGPEVVSQVQTAFGQQSDLVLFRDKTDTAFGVKFDLWAANRLTLEKAGVRTIETSGICTACQTADWYSHRGENGRTGRFGALIYLQG